MSEWGSGRGERFPVLVVANATFAIKKTTIIVNHKIFRSQTATLIFEFVKVSRHNVTYEYTSIVRSRNARISECD